MDSTSPRPDASEDADSSATRGATLDEDTSSADPSEDADSSATTAPRDDA